MYHFLLVFFPYHLLSLAFYVSVYVLLILLQERVRQVSKVSLPLEEGRTKVSTLCSRAALYYLISWPCLYLYVETECALKTSIWSSWWEEGWAPDSCWQVIWWVQVSKVFLGYLRLRTLAFQLIQIRGKRGFTEFSIQPDQRKGQYTALCAWGLPGLITFRAPGLRPFTLKPTHISGVPEAVACWWRIVGFSGLQLHMSQSVF